MKVNDLDLTNLSVEELAQLRARVDKAMEEAQAKQDVPGAIGKGRLEMLKGYKDNAEMLKAAAEQKKQTESEELIEKIQALRPRIAELIATGNACLESGIPLTGQGFGMRENYGTNQFMTNSWSHLVGFVGGRWLKENGIHMLGINAGGACGSYDFRTNGIDVYSVNENNPMDIVSPSVGHMKRFLNEFGAFEISFYAYVDKMIKKQQRSVASLLENANDRAGTPAGRANYEKELEK